MVTEKLLKMPYSCSSTNPPGSIWRNIDITQVLPMKNLWYIYIYTHRSCAFTECLPSPRWNTIPKYITTLGTHSLLSFKNSLRLKLSNIFVLISADIVQHRRRSQMTAKQRWNESKCLFGIGLKSSEMKPLSLSLTTLDFVTLHS